LARLAVWAAVSKAEFSLSLWERAGVRATISLTVSLTLTLSRREREHV